MAECLSVQIPHSTSLSQMKWLNSEHRHAFTLLPNRKYGVPAEPSTKNVAIYQEHFDLKDRKYHNINKKHQPEGALGLVRFLSSFQMCLFVPEHSCF